MLLVGAGVAVLLAGALLAVRWLFLVVTVTGPSMEPTYRAGDRVLVLRARRWRRGTVVVFHASAVAGRSPASPPDDRLVVKRIAAVPGDPVPEDVAPVVGAARGDRVPARHLVVLGDGVHSRDSRHWGYLPAAAVLGRVVAALPGRRAGT